MIIGRPYHNDVLNTFIWTICYQLKLLVYSYSLDSVLNMDEVVALTVHLFQSSVVFYVTKAFLLVSRAKLRQISTT